jgi:hypothetical protein
VSDPTLPGDRPPWAVATVRTAQAVLAILALAVLALAVLALAVLAWTAVAGPAPNPDPAPARPVIVTSTTLAPAGYAPTPAGPPSTAGPEGASR